MKLLSWTLTEKKIDEIRSTVLACAEEERWDDAWRAARVLVKAHARQEPAARALVNLLRRGAFGRERSVELAESLFAAHSENVALVGEIAQSVDVLHDIDYLNAAPPDLPLLRDVASRLRRHATSAERRDQELSALYGLACAARILGRTWDDVAESAALRLVELCPERWQCRYDLGLFYKTRGRFAEGQSANQAAADLGGAEDESVRWNLGICATGAGDAETALRVWKGLDPKIEVGRFGLPEGSYPMVKVRLAERPLAERDPAKEPDDPGSEESVWIERLSPCHGIIRNALYGEIGVDFGDVVLFDGAPITIQAYGDRRIPVFPHLTTLVRRHFQTYPFGGTQSATGQIAELSRSMPEDVVLGVHTEQVHLLCRTCWEDPDLDHADHRSAEHHVVSGKLCAPPSMDAAALLRTLDEALPEDRGVRLFVPELSRTAGEMGRAEVEARRLQMLRRGTAAKP